jgi:hypothetical protein
VAFYDTQPSNKHFAKVALQNSKLSYKATELQADTEILPLNLQIHFSNGPQCGRRVLVTLVECGSLAACRLYDA